MRKIKLQTGKFALVDNDWYEYLNQWKWYAIKGKNTFYASRRVFKNAHTKEPQTIYMHRIILGLKKTSDISDHKDRNGLNNQIKNLRISTYSQNNINKQARKNTTSKYTGVYWDKDQEKWRARAFLNRHYHLGYFTSQKRAYEAYKTKTKELYGEFASHLN